jgi:hypothetical protein
VHQMGLVTEAGGQGKCERSILLTAAAFLMLEVKRVSGKISLTRYQHLNSQFAATLGGGSFTRLIGCRPFRNSPAMGMITVSSSNAKAFLLEDTLLCGTARWQPV